MKTLVLYRRPTHYREINFLAPSTGELWERLSFDLTNLPHIPLFCLVLQQEGSYARETRHHFFPIVLYT